MKKIVAMALSLVLGGVAVFAEGYQVNTISARQNGMGSTGAAQKLGAESMYFNPAGMGFLDKRMDVAGSVTGVFPSATATLPDGTKWSTDAPASTPIFAGLAFSVYDNLKFGVSFYTPYGSNIKWSENWPGAILNQSCKLQTFTLQPSAAWRPIKGLSVGVGMMIAWGSVDLNKGLVSAESIDQVLPMMGVQYKFGQTTPASVNLKGTTRVALGVHLGATYDISEQVTVGASWRSKMGMKVKSGTASLSYANEIARKVLQQSLDVINNANFSSEMPMPWVLNLGVAYRPVKGLEIAADAQLTGWHTYRNLDIEFLDPKLEAYDQHLEKKYSNSWTFKVGASYDVTERFTARAGLLVDTTPIDNNHYNPETPGMTRVNPSVGLSFSPVKNFNIDASFMYVIGCGIDSGKCTYEDLMAKSLGLPAERTFEAKYNLHAFIPAIGVRYSF